jgi:hypothetical protein
METPKANLEDVGPHPIGVLFQAICHNSALLSFFTYDSREGTAKENKVLGAVSPSTRGSWCD